MGYSAQVQQSPGQYSSGKGSPMDGGNSGQAGTGYNPMAGGPNQPMGKGGAVTNSATSGQPRMGQPNMYPNTVGQAGGLGQFNQMGGGGKGKGGTAAPAQNAGSPMMGTNQYMSHAMNPSMQDGLNQPMYDEGTGMNPLMRSQGPVGPASLG